MHTPDYDYEMTMNATFHFKVYYGLPMHTNLLLWCYHAPFADNTTPTWPFFNASLFAMACPLPRGQIQTQLWKHYLCAATVADEYKHVDSRLCLSFRTSWFLPSKCIAIWRVNFYRHWAVLQQLVQSGQIWILLCKLYFNDMIIRIISHMH